MDENCTLARGNDKAYANEERLSEKEKEKEKKVFEAKCRRKARRPIEAAWAIILLSGPLILLCVSVLLSGHETARSPNYGGWAIVLVAALVLVAIRGHESRLRGAYKSQNVWLDSEERTLRKEWFPEGPSLRK